uniref:Uncharacterized protein n=1 Tax=Anopheles funestus TaxID=62324 RepID=A0A182S2I6_ANOFN
MGGCAEDVDVDLLSLMMSFVDGTHLFRNWAIQVDGRALGVLVAKEVRVQLLVSLQGDATALVVLLADQAVVGIIDHLDVINGDSGDAVVTVLLYADQTVVVDVHHLVVSIDEGLHRLQK